MTDPSHPIPPRPPDDITWVAYGPDAILLRFAERVNPDALARRLRFEEEIERHPPTGLKEWVPGFTTLMLAFHTDAQPHPRLQAPQIVERLGRLSRAERPLGVLRRIPVRYDGADLTGLATAKGLSVSDVIRIHSEPIYLVHLLGFAPGFPYLGELDPRLHAPRHNSPRTRVPAGTVAIGGEHTGIYPVDGPGGWNLIGHTETILFDPTRETDTTSGREMFLLYPGDRVQFVPIN